MDVTPPAAGASPSPSIDLTPRTSGAAGGKKKRKWLAPVVVFVFVAGAGVVLWQLLASATTYYCNADELGTKSGCETGKRFRLLGQVDQGSIVEGSPFKFSITHNGTTVPVSYEGQPAGKFQACVPVLVEGRMVNGTFMGDRIIVRHDENYKERNPDRVAGYDSQGACSVVEQST